MSPFQLTPLNSFSTKNSNDHDSKRRWCTSLSHIRNDVSKSWFCDSLKQLIPRTVNSLDTKSELLSIFWASSRTQFAISLIVIKKNKCKWYLTLFIWSGLKPIKWFAISKEGKNVKWSEIVICANVANCLSYSGVVGAFFLICLCFQRFISKVMQITSKKEKLQFHPAPSRLTLLNQNKLYSVGNVILLPPAYVVYGTVMFSCVSVCSQGHWGLPLPTRWTCWTRSLETTPTPTPTRWSSNPSVHLLWSGWFAVSSKAFLLLLYFLFFGHM